MKVATGALKYGILMADLNAKVGDRYIKITGFGTSARKEWH
jgi:hypothetical protein